ncbi:MAG: hypothetical protein COA82_12595 [Alkaliphilus sp.]|nr:hypothetical protein [bacterium AH-315-E09]PHS29512.1 MAG: hypothetical protein COA82_12595 [Alkaliphilus sp.]
MYRGYQYPDRYYSYEDMLIADNEDLKDLNLLQLLNESTKIKLELVSLELTPLKQNKNVSTSEGQVEKTMWLYDRFVRVSQLLEEKKVLI